MKPTMEEARETARAVVEAMKNHGFGGIFIRDDAHATEEGVWYHLLTKLGWSECWVTREQLENPDEVKRLEDQFREMIESDRLEAEREHRDRN